MPPDFNRDLTELLELNRECFSSIIFIAKAYVLVDCGLPLMFFITRATVLPGIPLRQSFYNQADIHGHLPAGIRGHLLTGICDHLLGCTCDTHGHLQGVFTTLTVPHSCISATLPFPYSGVFATLTIFYPHSTLAAFTLSYTCDDFTMVSSKSKST